MKIYFSIFVMCSFLSLTAQSNKNVEKKLFKINALAPGVAYELGVGDNSTLNFDLTAGFVISGGSNRETSFTLFPTLGAEYRRFVNFERRLSKNKNISGNSGNYVGFVNQIIASTSVFGNEEFNKAFGFNTAFVYGIQRTYPKGFYYGIDFGPSVFVNDNVTSNIYLNARIGWVIGKKKQK